MALSPVGIVPFDGTIHTCVIACSKEAKARGVKNVMKLGEAKRICPELILQPQSPDLYRRAHNALIAEINSVIPIAAIKSIDELCCKLDKKNIADPYKLARDLKTAIAKGVGPFITCSIGFAANRHLAKIACKMDKPDGVTIWKPCDMPAPLLPLPFDDIAGIGKRMEQRLFKAGIYNLKDLLATEPKHMRKLWRNVTGERLWYALHGYDVMAQKSERGMFGHGRVLPPELRNFTDARDCSRLLLVKAARRMRREGFYANSLYLWISLRNRSIKERGWSATYKLHMANDDQACLSALDALWAKARASIPSHLKIVRVGVTLGDLTNASARQLDMLLNDDPERQIHPHPPRGGFLVSWKHKLQILDFEADTRLEARCSKCGYKHTMMKRRDFRVVWLKQSSPHNGRKLNIFYSNFRLFSINKGVFFD